MMNALNGQEHVVKRLYRLYREEGLSLRLKRPRRNKAAQRRQPKQLAHAINGIWSMDFVADALFDGHKLRMLTVVDLFKRESLAIDVGQSLRGEDVVRVLTSITYERGVPHNIKSDNGSEFISTVMDSTVVTGSCLQRRSQRCRNSLLLSGAESRVQGHSPGRFKRP